MLHMPSPMLFNSAAARTYAEFQAHIATLATNGSKVWEPNSSVWGAPALGAFVTTAGPAVANPGTQNMFASPWLSFVSDQTNSTRHMIRHALPSESEFNAQVAAGRQIFFRTAATTSGPLTPAVTRNGYTSLTDGGAGNTRMTCPQLIYWDGSQAQLMQPSLGLGPTPYTW